MALLLRDEDVRKLLSMSETIGVIEKAFVALGKGEATNHPRIRLLSRSRVNLASEQNGEATNQLRITAEKENAYMQENGYMHILAASIPTMGFMGHKTYTIFHYGMHYVVMLYSAQDGELLAIIEADWLSGMRTGATSALATFYLARNEASTVGLIGAGNQAKMQLLGMCAVRPITQVFVYCRQEYNREKFCWEMSQQLNLAVHPAASAREAVEHADIVITATTSKEPVLHGEELPPVGCHINAIGSNWSSRREIDDKAVLHSNLIVTDSREQAELEAGDLLIPARARLLDFKRVHDLADVVLPHSSLRRQTANDITLYKGLGTGIEDIATAGLVYQRAIAEGAGEQVELLTSWYPSIIEK
jgi:ornithine cyclodeaminase/alanine dehydrogenase-like protein (mu-crystallin family)